MNMPGFTAEASVYAVTTRYSAAVVRVPNGASVQPQYVMPPWTQCSWLLFCCTEFGTQSCCRDWHLNCVPE